ncbi:MAG: Phenylalanine--tRNA ligase alpha subunit [Mycoplasmataceae bacterium]|nr:MAG: Phenylalanine--tRNA ligase alpha subunit [Mycoplasmataceae bacterium]
MSEKSEKIISKEEINILFAKSLRELESCSKTELIKKEYLEKGGLISQFFQQISQEREIEKRKKIGNLINSWKNKLVKKIEELEGKLNNHNSEKSLQEIQIDTSLEGKRISLASLHPITQIVQKIYDIFIPLGYQISESSEIETEEYNFDKLNMAADHSARDMHDTFYLDTNHLLRTHTSNTQIRVMENNPNQDLKIITSGKVYRRDEDDATHTHQFTQIEGLVVGNDISFSHLKGTLELVLKNLFGQNHPIRFRPSYFPFTEPSVEVDAQCLLCQGEGCNVCKKTGWVEVLGAGLVHPQVLKNCGFDSKKFTGFAFGLGVERLLMIQYGIEDIRHFYLNDIRFLRQFKGL